MLSMRPLLHCALLFLILTPCLANAAEPMPEPRVRFMINNTEYAPGSIITLRPGELVTLKAEVYGGRRDWCLFPEKYANIGQNTVILRNSDQGLEFTTGAQFRGLWTIGSETVQWYGQLNPEISPGQTPNTAVLNVPQTPGDYELTAKATIVWDYHRQTPAGVNDSEEENQAEATFTIRVEGSTEQWLSLPNVSAQGDEDDDLRFRLQNVQSLYELISAHLLNNKLALARSAMRSLSETFDVIRNRLDSLKQQNPGFSCTITLYGTPADAALAKLAEMEKWAEEWRNSYFMLQAEHDKVNQLLLNTSIVFTNNVLKSVFKNYINWGSQLPNLNNLFGAVPWQLSPLGIPSDVLGWYTDAQGDASILRNQVLAIQMMNKLMAFYAQRMDDSKEEYRKMLEIIRGYEGVKEVATELEGVLNSASWARRTAARQ